MNKYTLSGFILCAIGIGLAHAVDSAVFERVPEDVYQQMLHDGGMAYEHKDYPQAFKLTQRTACAGDKTSQEMLGRMYVLGQGVARDDLTGYAWLKLAAEF